MKKSSIGLLLLSALLCLSMLLVSCSKKEDAPTEPTAPTQQAATAEPIPEDVNIDPVTVLDKWNQYLTFSSPIKETDTIDKATYKFSNETGDKDVESKADGVFYVVTETEYSYPHGIYGSAEPSKYTYTVYSLRTGDSVFTKEIENNFGFAYNPECKISTLKVGGIELPFFEVENSVWEWNDFGQREKVTTYSYYNEKGELIIQGSYDQIQAVSNAKDNTATVEFDGKIYVYGQAGEHIFTFNKGEEKLIPSDLTKFGDLLYKNENDTWFVFDTSYNKLCEYTVNSATNFEQYYLSNGNLLFVYKTEVPENADFDAEVEIRNGTGKDSTPYIVTYEILDAKTGKTTAFKKDFVIDEEGVLLTAKDEEETGIGFKDKSHQLAVIRKVENGIASNDKTIVILDSQLNIVEELPTFVKSQGNVLRMLDANKLLICAETYNQAQSIYYTVDVNKKAVELFVNEETIDLDYAKGGFKLNNKLYNFDVEELLDLSEYTADTSYNGDYLILEDDDGAYLCYIENGKLVTKTIADSDDTFAKFGTDMILVTKNEYTDPEDLTSEIITTYSLYNSRGVILLDSLYDKPISAKSFSTTEDRCAWIKSGGDDDYAYIYYLK